MEILCQKKLFYIVRNKVPLQDLENVQKKTVGEARETILEKKHSVRISDSRCCLVLVGPRYARFASVRRREASFRREKGGGGGAKRAEEEKGIVICMMLFP